MTTNIYIVCPITKATKEQNEKMQSYVNELELAGAGVNVFFPPRDNPHEKTDVIGCDIMSENFTHMEMADEVHLFWDKESKGSYFDLGMAYAMFKPLYIINPEDIEPKEGLSWENFLCDWAFFTEEDILE